MCNNEITYADKVRVSKDIVKYIDKIEWSYGVLCDDVYKDRIKTALYYKMKYGTNFGKSETFHIFVTQDYIETDSFNFYICLDNEITDDDFPDGDYIIIDRACLDDDRALEFRNKLKEMFAQARKHFKYDWNPL